MNVVERGRKAGKEGGAARQEASVVTPPLSVPQRSWGHGGTEEKEGEREGGREGETISIFLEGKNYRYNL
jgi:hypothetical protein